MRKLQWIIAILLLSAASVRAELKVVASLPDFGAIAEAIGGKAIDVTTIARGSEDPHFVDARPSFVRVLNKADLLIEGGADLEAGWLSTLVTSARNPKIQGSSEGHLVLSKSVKLIGVPTGPVDRSMGDVHPTGNPHFWLDPRNGKIIAQVIAAKLAQLDPRNSEAYQGNLTTFLRKIDEKLPQWQQKLEPLRGAKVVSYHKSYEYLAAAFGFEIFAQLEPKPGIEPSATHIAQLVQRAKEADVKLVIIEPYRPRRAAEQVARAVGARMVILPDKTGSMPEAKNYIALFDAIVTQLTEEPAK